MTVCPTCKQPIRLCPECGSAITRGPRAEYCSRKCCHRATMRRLRRAKRAVPAVNPGNSTK